MGMSCADCGRDLELQSRPRWAGALHDERRRICDQCSANLMGVKTEDEREIKCEICNKVIGFRLAYGASVRLRTHRCSSIPVDLGRIEIIVSDAVSDGEVHLVTNGRTMAKIKNIGGDDGS